jgi:hypothetical protein
MQSRKSAGEIAVRIGDLGCPKGFLFARRKESRNKFRE